MEFNNYLNSGNYNNPAFDKYLYHNRQKLYSPNTYSSMSPPPVSDNSFSLDEILLQDSHTLLDKAVNTALSISYRVKIYKDTQFSLEEKWNELSSQIGALSTLPLGENMNIERRKSMLEKERNATERLFLENKLQTWKDLNEPVNSFIDYFHKEKASRLDQKILGE